MIVKKAQYKDMTFVIDRTTSLEEAKQAEKWYGTARIIRYEQEIARAKYHYGKERDGNWRWHYDSFAGYDNVDASTLVELFKILGEGVKAENEMMMKGMIDE